MTWCAHKQDKIKENKICHLPRLYKLCIKLFQGDNLFLKPPLDEGPRVLPGSVLLCLTTVICFPNSQYKSYFLQFKFIPSCPIHCGEGEAGHASLLLQQPVTYLNRYCAKSKHSLVFTALTSSETFTRLLLHPAVFHLCYRTCSKLPRKLHST